ncbi:MAG: class I SAM-dependent methyltransferase [Pseudomonadota bacterium]|nr:class I SAM-dependent methyltransferase [Pseudomonadota bacterium]
MVQYEDESFDALLCMGPMYHIEKHDKKQFCIEECLRVLRPGGVLVVSYISSYAWALDILQKRILIDLGKLPDRYRELSKSSGKDFMKIDAEDLLSVYAGKNPSPIPIYPMVPESLQAMLREAGASIETTLAAEGISRLFGEHLNACSEETFGLFAAFHQMTCEFPELQTISRNNCLICRKAP